MYQNAGSSVSGTLPGTPRSDATAVTPTTTGSPGGSTLQTTDDERSPGGSIVQTTDYQGYEIPNSQTSTLSRSTAHKQEDSDELDSALPLFAKDWTESGQPFQQKYVFRMKTKQPPSIPEEENAQNETPPPPVQSIVIESPSTSSEEISRTPSSPSASASTNSSSLRMENGEPMPRLAPGIYHRKPSPILSGPAPFKQDSVKVTVVPPPVVPTPGTTTSPMRGPPPTWLPPQPPDGVSQELLAPEEDYEDLQDPVNATGKDFSSRDHLVGPRNSYEVSVSQQRRSQHVPPLEDWPAEGQRVLHKNAEGLYYIPTTMRQGTLSPALGQRYDKECSLPLQAGSRLSRADSAQPTNLHQHSAGAASLKQKRNSKMIYKSEKDRPCRPNLLTMCLLFSLLTAILVIILLLFFRSPSYVYSENLPGDSRSQSRGGLPVDQLADLRPLPAVIHLGHRVDADLTPQSFTHTELYIPRPSRIGLNVTLGSGGQLVVLGRHSVPPSLSLHDMFQPIRADLIPAYPPSHTIELVRRRREAIEIVNPRSTVVEHFMLEGRWHLAIVNERNRVEPISILAEVVETTSDGESTDNKNVELIRCDGDCSGHGECVRGVCKCSTGYMGPACEEAVCPLVCSGNGVFSTGRCVCFEGFKGKECDVKQHWCEVADCNGRGRCTARGVCECQHGWQGDACEIKSCPHPTCSGRGVCVEGKCYCSDGFRGIDCSTRVPDEKAEEIVYTPQRGQITGHHVESRPVDSADPGTRRQTHSDKQTHPVRTRTTPDTTTDSKIDDPQALHGIIVPSSGALPSGARPSVTSQGPVRICSGNGILDKRTGKCLCTSGFTGEQCEEVSCVPTCLNGVCSSGVCVCDDGWKGSACDEKECAFGCETHGRCEKNGTCLCDQGWNGDNCHIEGCPRECSSHGQCRVHISQWKCVCDAAHTGIDCSVPIETSCDDGIDNDNDGLVDCEDPECCARNGCQSDAACVTVPSPSDVLLRLPSPLNAPFFERVMFLIKNDSVQSYSDNGQFNESVASVVRGRVVWDGGAAGATPDRPLPGVRVSDADHPLYGFTLSRIEGDGAFDLLVNGGRAVRLQFLRNPFQRRKITVFVPPNQIVYIGDIVMTSDKSTEDPLSKRARSECSVLKRSAPTPFIVTGAKTWGSAPVDGRPRLLVDIGAVVDSIPIQGTQTSLVYDSSRADGAGSRLHIQLLDSKPDRSLRLVHLNIDLAGRRFREVLAAKPNLTHVFTWDRLNAYRQTENGMVDVRVRIGYQYANCDRPSEIVWVEKRVQIAGRRSRLLPFGGWTLDLHHHYDVVNNVLERGDGSRHFLGDQTPVTDVLAGNSKQRAVDCLKCDGDVNSASLYRPTSLALCPDGSTLIADHNLIRRLTPDGRVITILSLSLPDTTYPSYLAVDPLTGDVYISMPLQKQIWKIVSMNPTDPSANHQVFAGDGTTCASGSNPCGDGGPAVDAQLFFPKGIAVDTQGTVYVADGRRVRSISKGQISSVADQAFDRPPTTACSDITHAVAIGEIQMEWPTSVSVDLHSDSLYVLDANVVYELKPKEGTARVVLGVPATCSNSTLSSSTLRSARDVTVSTDGRIFVLESDGKKLNQIRAFSPQTSSMSLFAGRMSPCACEVASATASALSQCRCDNDVAVSAREAFFNSPQAIVADSRGRLLVADTGNAKVKLIAPPTAKFDSATRQYSVQWPAQDEVYYFNSRGLHVSTKSLVTDRLLYTFNYNVDTHLGRLSQVSSPGGLLLRAIWQNETAVSIDSPAGLRSLLRFNIHDKTLESVTMPTKETVNLFYQSGGLLKAKASGGQTVIFGYDKTGRANSIAMNGHLYTVGTPTVQNGFSVSKVDRDASPYATFRSRDRENTVDGAFSGTLIQMDDDGYEMTTDDGTKTLYEAESHPLWSVTSIWRSKRTLPAISDTGSSPARRELIARFDWRPYVKGVRVATNQRGNTSRRRVAEVGARPRVNGVNVYAFEYDRVGNKDYVKNRNDDKLLTIEYSESGEWKTVRTSKEFKLAPLNVSYDVLGRRSEVVWGGLRRQWAYDRLNRVTERNCGPNEKVHKYTYPREGRHPVTVDVPSGDRYSIKYDSKARLSQISSPSSDVQYFSSIAISQGTVIKRRFPFSKKPFQTAIDSDNRLIEWTGADELQYIKVHRDQLGRPREITLNDEMTSLEYAGVSWRVCGASNKDFERRTVYQGHLPVQIEESRRVDGKLRNSSFLLTYDDLGRLTSLQPNVDGQALEGINQKWNERTGHLESADGYTVLNQADTQRISGYKTMVETQVDSHGELLSRKATAGSVRCSVAVSRDLLGRVATADWRRSVASGRETRAYDVNGRVAEWNSIDGIKWTLKYDKDGRLKSVNELTVTYSTGGVPKNIGTIEYTVDGNGWTIKKGNISYQMDALGRLTQATSPEYSVHLKYDEQDRVIWVQCTGKESTVYSLFYAYPHSPTLCSHFTNSKTEAVSTLYYTESNTLYGISSDGYRYAVLSDASRSPRSILYSSGSVKEVDYTPNGAVHFDSNQEFWIPVGYLGGIDLPEVGVAIIAGRPFDVLIGRWMSFGPAHTQAPPSLMDIRHAVDVFARNDEEEESAVSRIPLDLPSWLDLIGIRSEFLTPPTETSLSHLTLSTAPAVSLALSSFPSRLGLFTKLQSISPSRLSDVSPATVAPSLSQDDTGFADMLILIPHAEKTLVKTSSLLTPAEQKLITDILAPAVQVPWRAISAGTSGGWEQHFARSDEIPAGLSSNSHPHFTVVVNAETVELRAAKTKIITHFRTNQAAVRSKLAEEARRKETASIWRTEKKMVERSGKGRFPWTDGEKRELLSKGTVAGYVIEMTSSREPSILSTVYAWTFVRQGRVSV